MDAGRKRNAGYSIKEGIEWQDILDLYADSVAEKE
jgi:hypothetical protein